MDHESFFNPDDGRDISKHDHFDHGRYAETLAKALLASQGHKSLIVGLYGKWGAGKTSLFERAAKKLREEQHVKIIRVESWMMGSASEMLKELLAGIVQELGEEEGITKSGLSAIRKYGGALLRSTSVGVSLGFANVSLSVGQLAAELARREKQQLEKLRDDAKKALAKSKLRLIAFVDDLDRHEPEEVVTVLRVLKAGLNLPGITFLVGADVELLRKALNVSESERGEPDALEKIVQVAIHLPRALSDQHEEHLVEQMGAAAQSLARLQVEIQREQWREEVVSDCSKFVAPLLLTPRDAVRFRNALIVPFAHSWNEVNHADLALSVAIQQLFPRAYDYLRDHLDDLYQLSGQGYAYFENESDRKKATQKHLDCLLKDGRTDKEKKAFQLLLERLFPQLKGQRHEESWSKERRICAEEFGRYYFAHSYGTQGISEVVLDELVRMARVASIEEVIEYGKSLFEKKRSYAFIHGLRLRREEMDEATCKNIAVLLAHLVPVASTWSEVRRGVVSETPDEIKALVMQIEDLVMQIEDEEARSKLSAELVREHSEHIYHRALVFNRLRRHSEEADPQAFTSVDNREVGKWMAEQVCEYAKNNPLFEVEFGNLLLGLWALGAGKGVTEEHILSGVGNDPARIANLVRKYLTQWYGSDRDITYKFDKNSCDELNVVIDPQKLVEAIPQSMKDRLAKRAVAHRINVDDGEEVLAGLYQFVTNKRGDNFDT